jgi:hypothetical protein
MAEVQGIPTSLSLSGAYYDAGDAALQPHIFASKLIIGRLDLVERWQSPVECT